MASVGGSHYCMIVHDDYTRYAWLYFLKHESDASKAFEQFLSNVHVHGGVQQVRSDEGGKYTGNVFQDVCTWYCLKPEHTTVDSSPCNGAAQRAHWVLKNHYLSLRLMFCASQKLVVFELRQCFGHAII